MSVCMYMLLELEHGVAVGCALACVFGVDLVGEPQCYVDERVTETSHCVLLDGVGDEACVMIGAVWHSCQSHYCLLLSGANTPMYWHSRRRAQLMRWESVVSMWAKSRCQDRCACFGGELDGEPSRAEAGGNT